MKFFVAMSSANVIFSLKTLQKHLKNTKIHCYVAQKDYHAKSDFPKMRFKAQIRGKSIDVPSLMHIITLGKEHPLCV